MKTIKVRGLILREFEAGESDKRLLVLCKGQGRLMVYARGARKPLSKFMAAAQIFTYADFVLAKGPGFYSLTQADIIESFYPLREDYDRLMAAYKMADVCDKTLWDNIESDDLMHLLLKSLSILAKGQVSPRQALSVFLLRFFDVYGLRPQTDACVICDIPNFNSDKIMLLKEGLACASHNLSTHQPPSVSSIFSSIKISNFTLLAFKHILDSNLSQAFQFNATENVLNELHNATSFLWNCHFEQ